MEEPLLTDLAKLISKKFIQRPDAKAEQSHGGAWHPVRELDEHGKMTGPNIPWKMGDLRAHLNGTRTFGNYMVDQENNVKLFVLDIDLDDVGTWVQWPYLGADSPEATAKYFTEDQGRNDEAFMNDSIIHESRPREEWHNRKHPARAWYKIQLRHLSDLLKRAIEKELGIQTAIAYTGNKGLHVYGFTGTMPASQAREGALLALEAAALIYPGNTDVQPHKGKNFYKFSDDDPHSKFTNMTVEIFPKQETLSNGGYGNLVRLPLGRNLKHPRDECFFIDTSIMRVSSSEIVPHPDPIELLTKGY